MSGVTGGGGLRDLARKMRSLADPAARTELSRALAEESVFQVNESFRHQADPYDTAWQPTHRGGSILSDTGILRRSFTYKDVSPSGFSIGSPVQYANAHQNGAEIKAKTPAGLRFKVGSRWIRKAMVKVPARPMLPTRERGLPSRWRAGWMETAREFFKLKLGGE